MTSLQIIILPIALWRVSHMIVNERGFMDIFVHIRSLFGILHDDDGIPIAIPDENWALLLSCVWCLSMFLAIPYVIAVYFLGDWVMWFSLPFALSALAIAFDRLIGR